MSEHQASKATQKELAEGARAHYKALSMAGHGWLNTIPQAIDAWEREPELTQQLAEAQDNLRRVINETDYTDYLKRKVKTSQAYQVATERSYKVQVEHLKAELKEAQGELKWRDKKLAEWEKYADEWENCQAELKEAQEDLLEFMRSRKGKVEELKAANERIAELEGVSSWYRKALQKIWDMEGLVDNLSYKLRRLARTALQKK